MSSIKYFDFSNNRYSIWPDRIHFLPTRPEESSSGVYSGGEEKEREISWEVYAKILTASKAIVKHKYLMMEKRNMLTGLLSIEENGEMNSYILKRSAELKELVELMKVALGK